MTLQELTSHKDFETLLKMISATGATPALVAEALADRLIRDLGQLSNFSLDDGFWAKTSLAADLEKHRSRLKALHDGKFFFDASDKYQD